MFTTAVNMDQLRLTSYILSPTSWDGRLETDISVGTSQQSYLDADNSTRTSWGGHPPYGHLQTFILVLTSGDEHLRTDDWGSLPLQ